MKTRLLLVVACLLMISPISYSQSGKKIQVTGKITDANQTPVAGVMIFADNQNTGQVSNKKGMYKVKVDPGTKSIRVMTVTGEIAETALNGRTVVDFAFAVNFSKGSVKAARENKKEEDQVNIGYGSVDKKELLTPVTKVDSKKDKYVYKDIYEMLRGKPGVQVNGKTIKISQGPQTFTSGTDPLFVVDGVVVNTIDDITPSTVKSIEILKGPSASIYGSRGANGVILITLKKE
jgi:TonB-dependent SusC/RagA subfamily outer membrane receptor